MRGSPLLQLVLTLLAFAAAGLPVWRLTRPATAAAAAMSTADESAPAKSVALNIAVTFAPAPADFAVRSLGQTLLAGHEAQAAGAWIATIPKEGADLVLEAHWKDAPGPAAAQLTVQFPDGRQAQKTFWAPKGDAVADVLTVAP